MNPIYEQLNPQNNVMSGVERLKRTLNVNPEEYIKSLLKSGQITPNQLERAKFMASRMGVKI